MRRDTAAKRSFVSLQTQSCQSAFLAQKISLHHNSTVGTFSFSDAKTFTAGGDERIGRKYIKVVYREYRNAQFKEQKERTAADKHLGVLGPILRAEVGDTMEVVFKNMASSGMKFSMHPHGLYYRYKAMCFLSYFLDEVFVMCGIIKVEVSVTSRAKGRG